MTLQEANNLFEGLSTETTQKSEIKIFDKFIHILTELRKRTFSKDEIQSLETELDNLNLESNSENRKKLFNKQLKEFKDYLKEKHSLVSAGYYTNIGVTTGVGFGIVAGVIIGERFEKSLGIAVGIGIGMLIGVIIGRSMDAKVLSEGRMI